MFLHSLLELFVLNSVLEPELVVAADLDVTELPLVRIRVGLTALKQIHHTLCDFSLLNFEALESFLLL